MAASNEWTIWHLTPRGWERGSEREDFAGVKEVPVPSDCVLSMCFSEYIASAYSPADRSLNEKWRSDDEQAIRNLLAQFGSAPNHL